MNSFQNKIPESIALKLRETITWQQINILRQYNTLRVTN